MNAHARLFVFASLALAALFLFSSQFPARASAPPPEAWYGAPALPHPPPQARAPPTPRRPPGGPPAGECWLYWSLTAGRLLLGDDQPVVGRELQRLGAAGGVRRRPGRSEGH